MHSFGSAPIFARPQIDDRRSLADLGFTDDACINFGNIRCFCRWLHSVTLDLTEFRRWRLLVLHSVFGSYLPSVANGVQLLGWGANYCDLRNVHWCYREAYDRLKSNPWLSWPPRTADHYGLWFRSITQAAAFVGTYWPFLTIVTAILIFNATLFFHRQLRPLAPLSIVLGRYRSG